MGILALVPLILYLIFAISVFFEISLKTKTFYSLMVFLLLPIQHLAYGLGVLYNLVLNSSNKR
jgi:hypothetical protein